MSKSCKLFLLNFPHGYESDLLGNFEIVFAGKSSLEPRLTHEALNSADCDPFSFHLGGKALYNFREVKADAVHLQALARQTHLVSGSGSVYELQRLAHRQILYLLDVLGKYSVDAVCIAHVPHIGYDYALLKAATILSLPIYACEHNTFFRESYSILVYSKEGEWSRVDAERLDAEQYIPTDDCLTGLYEYFSSKFKVYNIEDANIESSTLASRLDKLMGRAFNNYRNNRCEKHARFYLHYQPEASTSFYGRQFNDQILAIRHFREICRRKSIPLVVQEHPLKSADFARGKAYYRELKNVVKYLPNSFYVTKLQAKRMKLPEPILVGTITGTVALEASISGINTVIYGQSWFEDFPNILAQDDERLADSSMAIAGSPLSLEEFCFHARDALRKRSYLHGCIYNQSTDWELRDSIPREDVLHFFGVLRQLVS